MRSRAAPTTSSPVAGSTPNLMSTSPFRLFDDTPRLHENPMPRTLPLIPIVVLMLVEILRFIRCWLVTVGTMLLSATLTLQPGLQVAPLLLVQ